MVRHASCVAIFAVAMAVAACGKSNDAGTKPPATNESVAATPPPPVTPEQASAPAPAPPPKPTFDRATLLSALDALSSRCIEFEPAVQWLKEGVVRIEYVHGCAEYEKADAGKVMWMLLQRAVSLAVDAGAEMPTFKIHAFTRNGSSIFTSITTPKDAARILNKELGFDDWLVRVGEGPKKLATGRPESDYLKALPAAPAGKNVPDGEEIKTDLIAYVEDLECAKDVSKLVLGKMVTIGYKEVCGHYEDGDVRLTMYEIALRTIKQFDKNGVWAGLDITARAENGGDVFTQKVPAQVLQGIKDRQVGIVDWVTRSYGGGAPAAQASAPKKRCFEGKGCGVGGMGFDVDGYPECHECCYGVSRDAVGFEYRCKYQGE